MRFARSLPNVVAKARIKAAPVSTNGRAPLQFVGSGSMLLDRVLGNNGWAVGRVANLVGDRSSGKTLIAVEACANFMHYVASPNDIRYVEAEMAYDEEYGRQIGMPEDVHPVDNIGTVEALFKDLGEFTTARKGCKTPSLYVVDSLDAMSDEAELKRDMGDGTYGTAKAKMMSEGFRRLISAISDANCTVLIISQMRDKINVMFGEKHTRSGGRALDFYASQIVWLSEIGKITKVVGGIKYTTGTHIKARNKKCKVGPAFRDAEMTLWFKYGIDDEGSMLDYLTGAKMLSTKEADDIYAQMYEARKAQDREWMEAINAYLREMVADHWDSVEAQLEPPMRKYA